MPLNNIWAPTSAAAFAYYSFICTYCVLNVKAALVMEGGRPKPRIISCHSFLVMTATIPPLCTTSLYSVYRSKTRLAMMGSRLIGVPENRNIHNYYCNIYMTCAYSISTRIYTIYIIYT